MRLKLPCALPLPCGARSYLIEAAEGLCLVGFPRPASAIRWALSVVSACLDADWWV